MFSVFPEKLFKTLSGLNKKRIEDLDIYNIINIADLKKFIIAAIDNPSQKFIFHYNFAPYAVVNQQFVTDRLINVTNGEYEPFKKALGLELDKSTKALNSVIPGYTAMSFEKKIDFVNSKLEIIFQKFSQMLDRNGICDRKGIRNVEFRKLSDINGDFALEVSRSFVCNSAIDKAKTFLMFYYTKTYPEFKIILSDYDRLTDSKTIYKVMDILDKTNVAFTVSRQEEGWNVAGMNEYILSHHLLIAQGKEASKIFKTAIVISQRSINLASQCFQVVYDKQTLEPNGSDITSLMFSLFYNGNLEQAHQEFMKVQGRLDKNQWKVFCQSRDITPIKQLAGTSWCPGNNPRDKELLVKYDLEDFIKGYKEVGKYLKTNKIYLTPSQCCFKFFEALEIVGPKKR
jgi:hypothetical protein